MHSPALFSTAPRPARTAVAVSLLAALSACSSPPQAPTVDDSTRRPVNNTNAIALQTCKGELSASTAALTEAAAKLSRMSVRVSAVQQSLAEAEDVNRPDQPATSRSAQAASAPANTYAVVPFELGSARLVLTPEQSQALGTRARDAKYIVVRGRTDALTDSPTETGLAKRRALAALEFLTSVAKVPAERIRTTWQGAGDPLGAGDSPTQRQANRRVEIEFYAAAPQLTALTR